MGKELKTMGKIMSVLVILVVCAVCVITPSLYANGKQITLQYVDFSASGYIETNDFHKVVFRMEEFLKKANYFPESYENSTGNSITIVGEKEDGSIWIWVEFSLRNGKIYVDIDFSYIDAENGASVVEVVTTLKDILKHIRAK